MGCAEAALLVREGHNMPCHQPVLALSLTAPTNSYPLTDCRQDDLAREH